MTARRSCVTLALAASAVALAVAPPPQARAGDIAIYVHVSVTNDTPTTLTLLAAVSDHASGTFWSDSAGNQVPQPAPGVLLQPGDTADFYIAGSAALLPDINGYVEYRDLDSSTGFFDSGVKVDFHDPCCSSNSANPEPRGWYTTSGFSFTEHGELDVTTPIVATDTCPGSGTGPCAYSSDHSIGSPGTAPGQFQHVRDVALDSRPVVYASDDDGADVQVFNPSGNYLTGWGTPGSGPGQFLLPVGVAAQPGSPGPSAGAVAVADAGNVRVQTFTPFGQFTNAVVGGGGSGFGTVRAVAIDGSGNIYVADGGLSSILKFSSTGDFVTSFRTNDFQVVWDVAIDPSTGNVVVLDSQATRVFRFKPDGSVVDSFPVSAHPEGIAVDQAGNTYVTDITAGIVTKYGPRGGRVVQWGARGADAGELNNPRGIAVDASNNVYVADTGNGRVQVFDLAESQLRFAGAPRVVSARARTASGAQVTGRAVVARVRCRARRGTTCRGTLTVGTATRLVARRSVAVGAGRSRSVRLRLVRLGGRRVGALRVMTHTRQAQHATRITDRRPLRRNTH